MPRSLVPATRSGTRFANRYRSRIYHRIPYAIRLSWARSRTCPTRYTHEHWRLSPVQHGGPGMRMQLWIPIMLFSATILPAAPRLTLQPTFERNVGQAAASVEWVVSSGAGAPMYLRATGAAIAQPSPGGLQYVEMRFEGASATAKSEGEEPLESYSNYYLGRDVKSWFTGVPHFARVRYREVYPGIDIVYRTNGGNVEYDFEVSPGADAARIHIAFRRIDGMRIGGNGDLILASGGAELRQRRPRVLQGGVEVRGDYRIRRGNRVEIALASYDHKRPL